MLLEFCKLWLYANESKFFYEYTLDIYYMILLLCNNDEEAFIACFNGLFDFLLHDFTVRSSLLSLINSKHSVGSSFPSFAVLCHSRSQRIGQNIFSHSQRFFWRHFNLLLVCFHQTARHLKRHEKSFGAQRHLPAALHLVHWMLDRQVQMLTGKGKRGLYQKYFLTWLSCKIWSCLFCNTSGTLLKYRYRCKSDASVSFEFIKCFRLVFLRKSSFRMTPSYCLSSEYKLT